MAVMQDRQGPDWPLGNIVVVVPGTPVSIMSLVDPGGLNDPANPTAAGVAEYTARAQQIMFQGVHAGGQAGQLVNNTGNIYVVRRGHTLGDTGEIIAVLQAGQTLFLASAPAVKDVFSPYRYYIDGDNAGDGAQVTLLIF